MASLSQIRDKRPVTTEPPTAIPTNGIQLQPLDPSTTNDLNVQENAQYRQAIAADALFKREYHRILSKMTVTNAQPPKPDVTEEEVQEDWSEEKYIAGLAQLERLQNEIDTLRTAIPSIIHSLATPHQTPLQLYKSFKTAAITSSKNISNLRQDWDSSQTNLVFARTDKSYSNNEDIEFEVMERVPEYGWAQKAVSKSEFLMGYGEGRVNGWDNNYSPIKKEEEDEEGVKKLEDVKTLSDSEIKDLLEKWQSRNAGSQGLVIEWQEDLSKIKITYRIVQGMLEFHIHPQRTSDPPIYKVTCPTRVPAFCPAIEAWFAIRPRQHDLEYTLEMAKAYMNARKVKCVVCDSMVDAGVGCSVRISKGEGAEREWIALHEKCRLVYKA